MRLYLVSILLTGLAFVASCEDGAPEEADAVSIDAALPFDGHGSVVDATPLPDIDWPSDAWTGRPVGAPCTASSECEGGDCILPEDGYPQGYCTYRGCDPNAPHSCTPYGGDGVCLTATTGTACFDRCDLVNPDCRVGYFCRDIVGEGICTPLPVCGDGVIEDPEECDPPNGTTCDTSCRGANDAPVGAPCSTALECAGDLCITEAGDGWPGGYCSEFGCDPSAPELACLPAGGDAVCLDAGGVGLCFDRCSLLATDCRAGYLCRDVGLGDEGICWPAPVCGDGVVEVPEECEPPDTATCDASCQGKGTADVGEPCVTSADCAGDFCIDDAGYGWPGGYCSDLDCAVADPVASCAAAGGDGLCVDVNNTGLVGMCLDRCIFAAPDCRTGYVCELLDVVTFTAVCVPAAPQPIGAPCTSAAECSGDTCLTTWPQGYCSQTGCDPSDPGACSAFGGDGICVNDAGTFRCLDACSKIGQCRAGYGCENFGAGKRACTPL